MLLNDARRGEAAFKKEVGDIIICYVGALGSVESFMAGPFCIEFGNLTASLTSILSVPDFIIFSSSSCFYFLSIIDSLFDLKFATGISFVPSPLVSSSEFGPLFAVVSDFLFAANCKSTFYELGLKFKSAPPAKFI